MSPGKASDPNVLMIEIDENELTFTFLCLTPCRRLSIMPDSPQNMDLIFQKLKRRLSFANGDQIIMQILSLLVYQF